MNQTFKVSDLTELLQSRIDEITIKSLNDKIDELKAEKIKILEEIWFNLYEYRTKEKFLTLEQFIEAIRFWNYPAETDQKKIAMFEFEEYYNIGKWTEYKAKNGFSDMLWYCHENDIRIPYDVADMICKACACRGCPHHESHLGRSCSECRKQGYTWYEGYCDE